MLQIAFEDSRNVRLLDRPDAPAIKETEILGRTLVSLTSPGTELNWSAQTSDFPFFPGYASIVEAVAVGSAITDIEIGTLLYASGPHAQSHVFPRDAVIPLPPGLSPEVAVFARLAVISMTTLATTFVRPPSRALITGLGPVGNLAAQVFQHCGYEVTAVDPVEARRDLARQLGIRNTRASIQNEAGQDLEGTLGLHVECSGHEQAVLDGARLIRPRGEIVLVGVPWKKRTEIPAAELLHIIFHRYAVVRSGWEWEIPSLPQSFAGASILQHANAALKWLAEGHLSVVGLADLYSPRDAASVYDGLRNHSLPTPAALFDWRQI